MFLFAGIEGLQGGDSLRFFVALVAAAGSRRRLSLHQSTYKKHYFYYYSYHYYSTFLFQSIGGDMLAAFTRCFSRLWT